MCLLNDPGQACNPMCIPATRCVSSTIQVKPEHRPDANTTCRAATKALAAFDVAAANAAANGRPGSGRPGSAVGYG